MVQSLGVPSSKTGQPENFHWQSPDTSYPAVRLSEHHYYHMGYLCLYPALSLQHRLLYQL